MRIGLFTSGYQRSPLEHAFEDAARFGYDYIELWGGRPHAYSPDLLRGGVSEVLHLADRHGVPVEVFCTEHNAYPYNFMNVDGEQWEDVMGYLHACQDAGKALGARFTIFSPGHSGYSTSYAETRRRLERSVRRLARYAEDIDHPVVIESLTPLESNVCTTADDLAELLDLVDSPQLSVMCDIVPPFVMHEPIMSYVEKLGDRLTHMHVVDSDGVTDTHLIPGEGTIPLGALMSEVEQSRYQGAATIELVTNYLQEPRLSARRAIENLRAVADR